MQSYGDFRLIPRNCANSFQTCVDKRTIFGQIAEIGQNVVQRHIKISSEYRATYKQWAREKLTLFYCDFPLVDRKILCNFVGTSLCLGERKNNLL